jgi:hypothetical protein
MWERRKKVEITADLVAEVLRQGYEVGLVKCTYGLPDDARLITSWFETSRNVLVLVFESYAWNLNEHWNGILPTFTPQFTKFGGW